MSRFDDTQMRIEYFNSEEFKQAEKERIENSLEKEHVTIDWNRAWCPVYGKIRPEWLCEVEHGDYHEILDEEE